MPTDAKSGGDYSCTRLRIAAPTNAGNAGVIAITGDARWIEIRVPQTAADGTDQSGYAGVATSRSGAAWGTMPNDVSVVDPGSWDRFPVVDTATVYLRSVDTNACECVVTAAYDGDAREVTYTAPS